MRAKSLYSINEAADIANCAISDLLQAAASRVIELVVGVPDGHALRLSIAESNPPSYVDPQPMRIPNMLKLYPHDCLKLQLESRALVGRFPLGYLLSPDQSVHQLHPAICGPEDTSNNKLNASERYRTARWNEWVTFADDRPLRLEVLPEKLLVIHEQIYRYIALPNSAPDENALDAQESLIRYFDVNRRHLPSWRETAHQSDQLRILLQASRRFWASKKIIKGERDSYPKNSEVEAWLIDLGFTKRLAVSGATIIRPSFADAESDTE